MSEGIKETRDDASVDFSAIPTVRGILQLKQVHVLVWYSKVIRPILRIKALSV